ncbi:hypothetical protein AJGP001_08525 [Planococcus faecalis]|uniref:Uncharacterized protein n=1 Tax=Planococcus faecalis TaxID=1598147 RepID=A0ABN4XN00_9BACL|nr:hypothetical protein AJGP001_08525 [Planococcus faecalis]OHX53909.1 hypothetical protein BB777_07635 [Planococcus faecalis]
MTFWDSPFCMRQNKQRSIATAAFHGRRKMDAASGFMTIRDNRSFQRNYLRHLENCTPISGFSVCFMLETYRAVHFMHKLFYSCDFQLRLAPFTDSALIKPIIICDYPQIIIQ